MPDRQAASVTATGDSWTGRVDRAEAQPRRQRAQAQEAHTRCRRGRTTPVRVIGDLSAARMERADSSIEGVQFAQTQGLRLDGLTIRCRAGGRRG